ncbi:MAG TPA: hypothetical protein VMZ30_18305 [Pyrinomonadaceae bacterium]|nr:hypothetical protein [Pyrinomonadaceae bacterium]
MPFRNGFPFIIGAAPLGRSPKTFMVQYRRGIAAAAHQAAEPVVGA